MGILVRWRWLWIPALAALSCTSPPPELGPPAESPGLESAPDIRVHPDNAQLIFRYYDSARGTLATAQGIAAVPEEVRPSVVVMDLSQQARVPPRALYVANLTTPNADGSFPWRVVDRYAHSREARTQVAAVSRAAKTRRIQLFSTEWCGVCKQARKWMKSRNLPFEERDLEKDPGALPALQKAARKAGVSPASIQGSVPVIVVGDQILKGFNKGAIEKAWKGK